jgi:peroxidase
MKLVNTTCWVFLLIWVFLGALSGVRGGLEMGFYDKSCPQAESIILNYVKKHISHAPTVAAPLLRMHFHDCFVRVSIIM